MTRKEAINLMINRLERERKPVSEKFEEAEDIKERLILSPHVFTWEGKDEEYWFLVHREASNELKEIDACLEVLRTLEQTDNTIKIDVSATPSRMCVVNYPKSFTGQEYIFHKFFIWDDDVSAIIEDKDGRVLTIPVSNMQFSDKRGSVQ